jgi:hypothetical protein
MAMACMVIDDLELCDNVNGAPEHLDIFGPNVSIADLIEAFTRCRVRRRSKRI